MDHKELERLLASMARIGASSLHLLPGRPPCLRVQRRFVQADQAAVAAVQIEDLLRDLLFEDHRQRLSREGQVDVLYVARTGLRYRATALRQEDGTALLMRPIPVTPPKLEELQLPQQVMDLARLQRGLVLITGSFGSGKSTTMAALVDAINHGTSRHVETIEDPIECMHPQAAALLHQREVGAHVADCATGLLQAKRLGADVVFVGELQDGAALEAALDVAESGCLVFAGFDASSVVSACAELPGLVPLERRPLVRARLAAALHTVTAQTLLPDAHGQGRAPMVEVLINNAAARTALREGRYEELPAIMHRCRGLGMQTADQALRGLLARHRITVEEALQHAVCREHVLGRAGTGASPRSS